MITEWKQGETETLQKIYLKKWNYRTTMLKSNSNDADTSAWMCMAKIKGSQNHRPKMNFFCTTLISSKPKNKNNSIKKRKKEKKTLLFVKEHHVPGGKAESGKLQLCVNRQLNSSEVSCIVNQLRSTNLRNSGWRCHNDASHKRSWGLLEQQHSERQGKKKAACKKRRHLSNQSETRGRGRILCLSNLMWQASLNVSIII